MHTIYDCLIVGAGIAAAAAAQRLSRDGLSVAVLEKASRPGGRIATTAVGSAFIDYGAQHLTIRDPRFRAALESINDPDLLQPWFEHEGETRHSAPAGMQSLIDRLFGSVPIFAGRRVQAIEAGSDVWRLTTEGGELFTGQSLILTPPLPQSLVLLATLANSASLLPRKELAAIGYHRCLALSVELAGHSAISPPGQRIAPSPNVHFAADCSHKGLPQRGSTCGVILLANPQFSLAHFDAADAAIAASLLKEAAPLLAAPIVQWELKRWRYSHPLSVYSRPFAGLDHPLPAAIAGDAFGGPRIEGAFLSGRSAAEWIISR